MNVSYVDPLQRAVARARSILFTPFRLETWLVLGFAAFLSDWFSGGWGQSGWERKARLGYFPGGHFPTPSVPGFHLHDLLPALVWGPLLAGLIALALIVGVGFLWLGSRGKFVFLEGVALGRAAIVEPWSRTAPLGNSLFLWRLGFVIVSGLLILGLVFATIGSAVLGWLGFHEPVAMAPPIVGGIALVGLVGLLVAFVGLLLDDFVVPLMYRHGLGANAAWQRFLPLLREHPGPFVLYALLVLVLCVAVGAAVMAAGFATCCVGFLLFVTPYVGQVVLLPLHVAYRALGPEFLGQFGPEFQVFAAAPLVPASEPAPPMPPPPTAPEPGAPA
jgi:hypothetical protein